MPGQKYSGTLAMLHVYVGVTSYLVIPYRTRFAGYVSADYWRGNKYEIIPYVTILIHAPKEIHYHGGKEGREEEQEENARPHLPLAPIPVSSGTCGITDFFTVQHSLI